jgi:hypothetical protein
VVSNHFYFTNQSLTTKYRDWVEKWKMSYVDFTGCIISPFGGCFLVPADTLGELSGWGQPPFFWSSVVQKLSID